MGQSIVTGASTHQAGESAVFEDALAALHALIGWRLQVVYVAGGEVLGANAGLLLDAAIVGEPGAPAETMVFRLSGGASFLLSRQTFEGYETRLGEYRIEGLDLRVRDAEIKLTTFEALRL